VNDPATPIKSPDRAYWGDIHTEQDSWRKQLIGEINEAFVVPRYVKVFYDTFGTRKNQAFLEVGSGNGDLSRAILAENRGQIARYVCSDYFPESVEWLRKLGIEAIQADAQALPCADAEYDAVVDFDVMHHVDAPREMAKEMMRVGRGRALLVESNGMSLPRRLLELTPGHRAAGERSYTPAQYKSFFVGHPGYRLTGFAIYPFLFPFKCPRWFLPTLVWFNRRIESIPFFRWQCSSVVITIDYAAIEPGNRSSSDEGLAQ
jgi:SAM-dependent methyltransferase